MDFVTIATVVGLSTIISTIVSFALDSLKKKKEVRFSKVFEEKYRRFNHMLSHMLIILDISNLNGVTVIEESQRREYERIYNELGEMELKEHLLNEMKNYIYFYYLFGSEEVMSSLIHFLSEPTDAVYIKVAKKMRKDLWK